MFGTRSPGSFCQFLFIRFRGGGHFEFGGEGVAPAAAFIAQVTDGDTGDTDGAVGFGKLGQALVDGVGEDGPEVFFGGGIVRVRLRVGGPGSLL